MRPLRVRWTGCLKARGLAEKILYLVTTLGVPLRIEGSGGMQGDRASVDSELAMLYADMHGSKHALAGPLRNPFFGARREAFSHPRFPMYLVSRLAAYDVGEVKAMIDRSLAARNRGRVVLDLQSEDDAAGNNWLRDAALLLPKERVVLDENDVGAIRPKRCDRVRGLGVERFESHAEVPRVSLAGGRDRLGDTSQPHGRTFARPPESWKFTTWNRQGALVRGLAAGALRRLHP